VLHSLVWSGHRRAPSPRRRPGVRTPPPCSGSGKTSRRSGAARSRPAPRSTSTTWPTASTGRSAPGRWPRWPGSTTVTSAAGGLTLTDVTVTGTVRRSAQGGGSYSSSFTTGSFTVEGVDLAHTALGSLSSAKLTSGAALTAADAAANDALVDSGYAAQTSSRRVHDRVGGTKLQGHRHRQRAAGQQPAGHLHPAGQGAGHRQDRIEQPEERGEHNLRIGGQPPGTSRPCRTRSPRWLPHATITDAAIWPTR